MPVAVGLALADKMARRPRVTACFFGEGAVAEGEFHECLNLAALCKLPFFGREKNLAAMATAPGRSESETDLSRASSYEMPPGRWTAWTWSLARKPRGARGPRCGAAAAALLEFRTTAPAPIRCRPPIDHDKQEVEEWKQRDPILTYGAHLRELGLLDDDILKGVEDDVAAEVDKSVQFAEDGTWEPVEDVTRFVYSERTGA